MAIFLTKDSRVLVQGITGSEGVKHTRRMVASGTQVVAGVTPGKAGQDVDGIPVFSSVPEATIRRVCLTPSEPVMPCTSTLLSLVRKIAIADPLPTSPRRRARPRGARHRPWCPPVR